MAQELQRMKTRVAGLLVLLSLCTSVVAGPGEAHINDEYYTGTRTYIVHMDRSFTDGAMAASTLATPLSRYSKLLQTLTQATTTDNSNGELTRRPIHVYSSVCNGFSARLTSKEATALRAMSGVLRVLPDKIHSLHTTRTPQFLGFNAANGLWPLGDFGEDVIVGVVDTGVWPERESFSDAGLGPVPARWKGTCEMGPDFNASNCNRKLIGARYYVEGYEAGVMNATGEPANVTRSPRDTEGHGTHTASTAAGSEVAGANLFGLANGTARGMAPKARIAVYKVCWPLGCFTSDTLAAFDQAIADGVDIISLSVGGPPSEFFDDGIAIAAFGAMQKGVFVSCSAGNSGPGLETVVNDAPWIMTVAASTLDRDFPANATLGDAQVLQGQSLWNGASVNETEMITGAAASLGNVSASTLCLPESLDPALVKGKIVVCQRGSNRVAKGAEVLASGGVGMILYNGATASGVLADAHLLPATHVDTAEGAILLAYMNSTRSPVGSLRFAWTRYNVTAPVIAGFSSRGPSTVTPQVLKPDITAPGVNVLAAWTGAEGLSAVPSDTRRVSFNIISGTSMSCPHVSGLAALLKAAHRDWSPAAIKSALMTTATLRNNVGGLITDQYLGGEATPFEYGSGHVRPDLALDPGLVYDMEVQDYVNFLCAIRYSQRQIQMFTNETVNTCPVVPVRVEDMNYPSFAAVFTELPSQLVTNMTRTVTNVGSANATYRATIAAPDDTVITVSPDVLSFSAVNEKKSFTVQVTIVNAPNGTTATFGFLTWSDGVHVVQSPIAITVYN